MIYNWSYLQLLLQKGGHVMKERDHKIARSERRMLVIKFPGSECLAVSTCMGFPGGSVVKNVLANAGNACSIPESGRPPGEGNGNPL